MSESLVSDAVENTFGESYAKFFGSGGAGSDSKVQDTWYSTLTFKVGTTSYDFAVNNVGMVEGGGKFTSTKTVNSFLGSSDYASLHIDSKELVFDSFIGDNDDGDTQSTLFKLSFTDGTIGVTDSSVGETFEYTMDSLKKLGGKFGTGSGGTITFDTSSNLKNVYEALSQFGSAAFGSATGGTITSGKEATATLRAISGYADRASVIGAGIATLASSWLGTASAATAMTGGESLVAFDYNGGTFYGFLSTSASGMQPVVFLGTNAQPTTVTNGIYVGESNKISLSADGKTAITEGTLTLSTTGASIKAGAALPTYIQLGSNGNVTVSSVAINAGVPYDSTIDAGSSSGAAYTKARASIEASTYYKETAGSNGVGIIAFTGDNALTAPDGTTPAKL